MFVPVLCNYLSLLTELDHIIEDTQISGYIYIITLSASTAKLLVFFFTSYDKLVSVTKFTLNAFLSSNGT